MWLDTVGAYMRVQLKDSRTMKEPAKLFSQDEWLWPDPAYTIQPWVVTLYKRSLSLRTGNRILTTMFLKSEYDPNMLGDY